MLAVIGLLWLMLICIKRIIFVWEMHICTRLTFLLVGLDLLRAVWLGSFTRSGNLDMRVGILRVVGTDGNNWSKLTYLDIGDAYHFGFNRTNVYAAGYYPKWYGFLVRCQAN